MSNKYNIKITKDDMTLAQKDSKFAYEIIERMMPLLVYFSKIIYYVYKAEKDPALSLDDIVSFMRIQTLKGIRSYDPDKYDNKKDKLNNKVYLDGYRYLSLIVTRSLKTYHNYHYGRSFKRGPKGRYLPKRIPLSMFSSYRGVKRLNFDNEDVLYDMDTFDETCDINYMNIEKDKNSFYDIDRFKDIINDICKKHRNVYIKNINTSDVLKMLFLGYTHEKIANEMGTTHEIIFEVLNELIDNVN